MQVRNPRALTRGAIISFVNELLNSSGVRISRAMTENQYHNQRTAIMQLHGFRKYFMTTCINAGISPIYTDSLMGHDLGLTGAYTKLTPEDLLEGNDKNLGYTSAMEHLIINNENRLQLKVQTLQIKSKLEDMQQQIDRMNKHVDELTKTYLIQTFPGLPEMHDIVKGTTIQVEIVKRRQTKMAEGY
jgi:hypothetical protein